MEQVQTQDDLFSRWRVALGANAHQFHADGVIDETQYALAQRKVLFLCKEPNNMNGDGFDFREWWRTELKYRLAHRLELWAEGLLHDFPPYEDLNTNDRVALRSVAFMNVKKTGGRASSEYDDILDHTIRYRDLLLEQIRAIDPEIIVGSLTWWPIYETLFDKGVTDKHVLIEDMRVFQHGRARVIDFYHPSNRYPSSMQYALLSRVVGSERFKNL